MRWRDMLAHGVDQRTDHRGHIAMMEYRADAEASLIDFPVFLRDAG